MSTIKTEQISIIGAGLCGSLLALRLAQRGYKINLYEKRPDLRTVNISSGRSINLALSDRGLRALRLAGVEKQAKKLCIPMYGRLIHDEHKNTFTSNYSGRENECINSISRQHLTAMLLDEAEKHENVNIHFNVQCTGINLENNTAHFKHYQTKEEFSVTSDLIFGTDGVGSSLRKSYVSEDKFLFSYAQEYLTHGYKELHIPPTSNGSHKISKDHLHIWPRGNYMLIALPNLDGSFTLTLFLSYEEGAVNFKNLDSTEKITKFFEEKFPDVLALNPEVISEFDKNPTGVLGTIKCYPWHYKNKTLLMGDSCHAIVPFYGQGMNASFEDVAVFDEILDKHEGDWETIFKIYEKKRKIDTDAISDLAIENYYEMRDHVTHPIFKEKRELEMQLERKFPKQYFSKYSLVTFNEHIGYHRAHQKGNAQNKALLNLLSSNQLDDLSLDEILKKVNSETNEILEENKIASLKK